MIHHGSCDTATVKECKAGRILLKTLVIPGMLPKPPVIVIKPLHFHPSAQHLHREVHTVEHVFPVDPVDRGSNRQDIAQ
jgi:hypothetical protein